MYSSLFTRILVPYDGSSHSKKALSRAIEVAHNVDSELLLFSVVNVTYIRPPGLLKGLSFGKAERAAMKKFQASVIRDTKKMLEQAVSRCKKDGTNASYVVGRGNISEEILKLAKKRRSTIIIIGSQGLHGFGKIKTLGSVSRKVSELAHCPVLIVR